MKKIILSAFLAFAGITGANAQCQNGSTIDLSTNVSATGSYTLDLSSSLCGSTKLRVKVRVNNRVVFNDANWQNGDPTTTFSADSGDVITVTAVSGHVDPNIICVWAGEINACILAHQ